MNSHEPEQSHLLNPASISDSEGSLEDSTLPRAGHSLARGRDNEIGYDSYYSKMDAVSAMKVAITTAYIPTQDAVIVDLGFGTGKTSFDLANLYPKNTIVGVDIDPHAIKNASAQYDAKNLRFIQRDFSNEIFTANSVDVFFLSSAVHEVPSYAREDRFHPHHIQELISVLGTQLKPGGLIIIGDFLKDSRTEDKVLFMRTDDGDEIGNFAERSSAALFRDFLQRFRCYGHEQGELISLVTEIPQLRPGWTAFRGPAALLDEFQHRRTYTTRWLDEIEEQYLHFDVAGYEALGEDAGLRVVRISPIINEWIVNNWWDHSFESYTIDGNRLPHPPNKVHAIYQKVLPEEGRSFDEVHTEIPAVPSYLDLRSFRNEDPQSFNYGKVYDLARRPGTTLDTIVYTRSTNGLQVLIKQGYPRPIVTASTGSPNIDGSIFSGYITELISDLATDSEDDDIRIARERGNIDENTILSRTEGLTYLSSPGGVDERIRARLVEVSTFSAQNIPHTPYSGFSTSGRLAVHDSRQLLRAYQTGDMVEPRLEVNLHHLHRHLDLSPGQWIGAEVNIQQESGPLPHRSLKEIREHCASREVFSEVSTNRDNSFLEIRRSSFQEQVVGENEPQVREYVIPKKLSCNTIMLLPMKNINGEYYLGLEVRDLPAAQVQLGNSSMLTVPGFRVSKDAGNMMEALRECGDRMEQHFQVRIQNEMPLGMKYYPSPGITPENVHMFAVEVSGDFNGVWCSLTDLLENYKDIHDLHLLVAIFRSAHALGLLEHPKSEPAH